jgi:hypothetical protein
MSKDQIEESEYPINPKAAREQAADFLGFMAGLPFQLGEGRMWELPNPAFLDPEQRTRYREYQRTMKTLDKEQAPHPFIDDKTIEQTIYPYLKDGKDFDADEQLCIALMGEQIYAQFITAGGVPGQIDVHWNVMRRQLEERAKGDSKSS